MAHVAPGPHRAACLAAGIALAALLWAPAARAGTFELVDNAVRYSGKIERGDYDKLLDFLDPRKHKVNFHAYLVGGLRLNSGGGNVAEGFRIARFVEASYAHTYVEKSCQSACTFIWAAGVQRTYTPENAKLGFHRLKLVRDEVSLTAYEKSTMPNFEAMESWMDRQGIPQPVIDKMKITPPTDMFIVTREWAEREGLLYVLGYRPMFLDIAEKKCGRDPLSTSSLKRKPNPTRESVEKWQRCATDIRITNQEGEYEKILAFFRGGEGKAKKGK